jgi:transcription elongation factor GreA
MKITASALAKYQNELATCEAAYEEAVKMQVSAKEFGDLSENEEYATASAQVRRLSQRIKELKDILNDYEIIPADNSPRITIGSTVEVTRVDANGNKLKDARVFRLDSEGDTILEGVLGIKSPLGSAILNGTDGTFKIANDGGKYYKVRKLKEGEDITYGRS